MLFSGGVERICQTSRPVLSSGRAALTQTIQTLDQEITAKLTERLQDGRRGPWFLTSDAATNRGDPLISVDAMNAAGERWHVKLVCCGAEQQDAGRIKAWIDCCLNFAFTNAF